MQLMKLNPKLPFRQEGRQTERDGEMMYSGKKFLLFSLLGVLLGYLFIV